ncbi:MAG: DUF2520 domain-containing protein [Microscillaceae bacterium]|jgi:predicted short-subunit dehydrogenase-like oxidoreductase (DUF2520 family)|nr:DUF2520 domain-containing protein [Microscillaceae bacterium]
MKIALIGSGNVAWHLAPALQMAGNEIVSLYSRNLNNAKALADKLSNPLINNDLDFLQSEARLFIIAIKDDAISAVASELKLPKGAILVHTSGSKGLESLTPSPLPKESEMLGVGVFYPLQTFSKNKVLDFKNIPFCIEGSNEAVENALIKLAQGMSNQVFRVSSEQRKTLHIAAVFACNFSNHLLSIAQDILQKNQLDFSLLQPLIEETIAKALTTNPDMAQTGPARRGDTEVIARHTDWLKNEPIYQNVYELMTQSILAKYHQS